MWIYNHLHARCTHGQCSTYYTRTMRKYSHYWVHKCAQLCGKTDALEVVGKSGKSKIWAPELLSVAALHASNLLLGCDRSYGGGAYS